MGVKVTTNLHLLKIPKDIQKEFIRKNSEKRALEASFIELITQGKSPTKGVKWKDYTPGYAKIKRGNRNDVRPVDMVLSGKTIKSFRAIKKKLGTIELKFKGRAIIARHFANRRQLFPETGQSLKASILRVITKLTKLAVSRSVKKANR